MNDIQVTTFRSAGASGLIQQTRTGPPEVVPAAETVTIEQVAQPQAERRAA